MFGIDRKKIYLLIVFLFVVLLIITGYLLIRNQKLDDKFSIANPFAPDCFLFSKALNKNISCGLNYTSTDNTLKIYLGKFLEVKKNNGKVVLSAAFENFKADFYLGNSFADNINIFEKNIDNFGDSSSGEVRRIQIDDIAIKEMNEKYKSKFLEIYVFTPFLADRALVQAEKLLENPDESTKKAAENQIRYWTECKSYLDFFIKILDNREKIQKSQYNKLIKEDNKDCTPIVKNIKIYI